MSGTAMAKAGLAGAKIVFSPVGLTILSVLLILILGINPLFILFDLIIKSMNILSGNALIQQAVNGVFDPKSPIFIIYITVFLTSFLLGVVKIVRGGLGDIALGFESGTNGKEKVATFSGAKMKWLLIWLVSWIALPFAFGVLMYIINLFAGLFALDPTTMQGLFVFSADDWTKSVSTMQKILIEEQNKINGFLATFFPADIDKAELPDNYLDQNGITVELWREFLKQLAINGEAIAFKNDLQILQTKIQLALNSQIFNYINGEVALELDVSTTTEMINNLATKINEIISQAQNIKYDGLNRAIANVSDLVPVFKEVNVQGWINDQCNNLIKNVNAMPTILTEGFNGTKLNGIAAYGLDGQSGSGNVIENSFLKPEKLTVQLASALYQIPVYSYRMSIISGSGNFEIPFFVIIKIVASLFVDPLRPLSITISTFAFAFCFTTFMSILLMFAARLFDFISAIVVAPYAAVSGISDNGEKYQTWFKTFFGKALTVLVISISISIFVIVISLAGKFLITGSTSTGQSVTNDFGIKILNQFLMMTVTIATCSAMLEFVGWAAQMFSNDNKIQKYRNNFTQKKMNTATNINDYHNSYRMNNGFKKESNLSLGKRDGAGGSGSINTSAPPALK